MKLKLLILALIVGITTQAQISGYTTINQKYYYPLGNAFGGINIPSGTTPAHTSLQTRMAGALYYDSTGIDSGLYVFDLVWQRMVKATELSSYTLRTELQDTAAAIRASISGVGVTDGDKGDITVSSTGTVWTVDINAISDAKLRQSAALSVIGRSANSTGNAADIAAGTDGHVLRRSGTTLGFGQVATAGITDAAVTYAKVQNVTGRKILGNLTGSSATVQELPFTAIDTTDRDDGDILAYDDASDMLVFIPEPSGGGTPGGSDTHVQFNRNGSFAGNDSLAWTANGLENKYRYRINGSQVLWLPNQTDFLNTLYVGAGGASLSHTTGITGQYNTIIGMASGTNLTTGSVNVGVGSRVLPALNTGTNNVAVGDAALFSLQSGAQNVAIGMGAMQNAVSVLQSGAIGYNALFSNTGNFNYGFGNSSLYSNTSGTNNIGVGFQTLYHNQTGTRNVAIGEQAGVGVSANSHNNNTFIGYKAGFGISTAGNGNVLMGYQAGDNVTTGDGNIIIGNDIDAPSATGDGQIAIGNLFYGTGATGTGTTSAGNAGIGTNAPREKLDVDGVLSIRTVNAGTSVDSIAVMEDGRVKSVAASAIVAGANVSSAEYTPTLTDNPAGYFSNVTSSSHTQSYYKRIGDIVTVWGNIDVVATSASTNTAIAVTFPVASNLSAASQLIGFSRWDIAGGSTNYVSTSGDVQGDATNDRAIITFNSTSGAGATHHVKYEFTYKIIPL